MRTPVIPSPTGRDKETWIRELTGAIEQILIQIDSPRPIRLEHKTTTASAVEDGILMWDSQNHVPVISYNGEWRQIALGAAITGGVSA